jgi:hypothetical protein
VRNGEGGIFGFVVGVGFIGVVEVKYRPQNDDDPDGCD